MKPLLLTFLTSILLAPGAQAHLCQTNPDAAMAQIRSAVGTSLELDAGSLRSRVSEAKADIDAGNVSAENQIFVKNLAAIVVIYKESVRDAADELGFDRGNSPSTGAARTVRSFVLTMLDLLGVTMDLVKAGMNAQLEGRTLSEPEVQPYLNQLAQLEQRAGALEVRNAKIAFSLSSMSESEKSNFVRLMKEFETRTSLNVCLRAHAKFVK